MLCTLSIVETETLNEGVGCVCVCVWGGGGGGGGKGGEEIRYKAIPKSKIKL